MKVLFIWPNKDQFGFKPMSISILVALLKRAGHEVDLFDTTYIDFGFRDNSEVRQKLKIFKDTDLSAYNLAKTKINLSKELVKKLDDFNPDVVALSVLSDEIYIGLEASEIVKGWNPKTIVLWGNKAASMAADKILKSPAVDYLCVGEGISFFPEFMECLSSSGNPETLSNIVFRRPDGSVKRNPLAPYYQNLDALPYYDWSLFDERHHVKPFDGQVYRGADHMMYWGCPNICTYCINRSYRKLYGKDAGRFLRCYSVERIIDEIAFLSERWGIEFYKFHDEDFCLKPLDYFKTLAKQYAEKIGIPFTIMANARNVTAEKVALLKKMNCVSVTIGIETGNQELRKKILKRNETTEDIIRAVGLLNDAGIRTSAFNMLAIPFETRKTIFETIEINRKAKVQYPNAGFFFPLEETELHRIAVEEGFYDPEAGAVFKNDEPTLTLPDISSEELVTLRERFTLYIKLPKALYPFIERSEQTDTIGEKLTTVLYKIYNRYVFSNGGFWDDAGQMDEITKQLNAVAKGEI